MIVRTVSEHEEGPRIASKENILQQKQNIQIMTYYIQILKITSYKVDCLCNINNFYLPK